MKIVKELKEQYAYLWWWLLSQGIFISTILVNTFMLFIFVFAMTAFYFVMRWLKGH
jgi:hypothetical protein